MYSKEKKPFWRIIRKRWHQASCTINQAKGQRKGLKATSASVLNFCSIIYSLKRAVILAILAFFQIHVIFRGRFDDKNGYFQFQRVGNTDDAYLESAAEWSGLYPVFRLHQWPHSWVLL